MFSSLINSWGLQSFEVLEPLLKAKYLSRLKKEKFLIPKDRRRYARTDIDNYMSRLLGKAVICYLSQLLSLKPRFSGILSC